MNIRIRIVENGCHVLASAYLVFDKANNLAGAMPFLVELSKKTFERADHYGILDFVRKWEIAASYEDVLFCLTGGLPILVDCIRAFGCTDIRLVVSDHAPSSEMGCWAVWPVVRLGWEGGDNRTMIVHEERYLYDEVKEDKTPEIFRRIFDDHLAIAQSIGIPCVNEDEVVA